MGEKSDTERRRHIAFDRSVSCEHLENYQVLLRAEGHSWLVDEPPEVDGDGLAPNPFDMLLGSLGSCTLITVWHHAVKGKVPVERMWLDTEIARTGKGKDRRYDIRLVLKVRGDLSEEDLARIRRYADLCPVHGILSKGVNIETRVEPV